MDDDDYILNHVIRVFKHLYPARPSPTKLAEGISMRKLCGFFITYHMTSFVGSLSMCGFIPMIVHLILACVIL